MNRLNKILPTLHEQQGFPSLRLHKLNIQKESIEQDRQCQVDRLSAELNEVNRAAILAQQHADPQFYQKESDANQIINLSHYDAFSQEC